MSATTPSLVHQHDLSRTRAIHQVIIMRRTLPAAAAAVLLFTALPLAPAAAQTPPDSARRETRAQTRDRERRERERRQERINVNVDHDDHWDDDDDRGGVQGRTAIDTTVAFSRGGVVDLSLVSGEIRVVGWTRSEVKVVARSERGGLRFEASPSRVALDVERRGHGRNSEATFELSVPEGTRVLMRSTSGDLAARGVKGEVEARSVSGGVEIEDAGRISVATVSGDVRAVRLAGEARARSVSGEVALRDVAGDVDAESVSGDVELRGTRARVARVETVSGDVTYDGAVDPAGRYDFHSHSGTLRLMLPAATNASLSVRTFSGEIDSAFPLTVRPASVSEGAGRQREMEFTIGSGGPRISAQTFSGEIVIERAGNR